MTTREAIRHVALYFINKRETNPSEADIRLCLNDLVSNHDYAQGWAVNQVRARLRKISEVWQ